MVCCKCEILLCVLNVRSEWLLRHLNSVRTEHLPLREAFCKQAIRRSNEDKIENMGFAVCPG
jgi:hypothetical protein